MHVVTSIAQWMLIMMLCAIAALTLAKQCSSPEVVLRQRVDTVVITPEPITLQSTTTVTRWRYRHDTLRQPDTIAIRHLLAQNDSLRSALNRRQIDVVTTLDTITSRGDTVHVECNEVSRSILLAVRHAPVITTRTLIDTLRLISRQPPTRLGISVGAGIDLGFDGIIRPGLGIHFGYQLFP